MNSLRLIPRFVFLRPCSTSEMELTQKEKKRKEKKKRREEKRDKFKANESLIENVPSNFQSCMNLKVEQRTKKLSYISGRKSESKSIHADE
uniref:Uncharacterized protein n=1 Tax=Manihot esculenta TaxID=3983 RepID=A0A2C9UK04_MANES